MNRLIRGLAFWYIILAAGMAGAILLDRNGGIEMQGPLLPGQTRPIIYPE